MDKHSDHSDWRTENLFFFDKGREIRKKRQKKTFDSLTESQQQLSVDFAKRRKERSLSKELTEETDSNSTVTVPRISGVLASDLDIKSEADSKTSYKSLNETSRFLGSFELLAIRSKGVKVRITSDLDFGDEDTDTETQQDTETHRNTEDTEKRVDSRRRSKMLDKGFKNSRLYLASQQILAITKNSSRARSSRFESNLNISNGEGTQESDDPLRSARKQVEREFLQQQMYEKQLAKYHLRKESSLQLNDTFQQLEIRPRSLVEQDSCQSTTVSISPPPRSPITQDTPVANDRRRKLPALDFNEFYTPNGLNNKGFHGSNSILVMPMRKSTSDLYLPDDDSIAKTTKRRSSEEMVGNGSMAYADKVPRRFSADVVQPGAKVEAQVTPRDKQQIKQQPIDESLRRKLPKINRRASKRVSAETAKAGVHNEGSSNEANSDDYDDICDVREIYERKMRNKNGETESASSPTYHVVEKECENNYDHSYSNPEDSSDADSHIYTNLEESIDESHRRDVENDDNDDPYENIDFAHRRCNGNSTSNDPNDSETSSVSYENVEFLTEILNDQQGENSEKISARATDSELNESDKEEKKIPPPIPRKVYKLDKQRENGDTKAYRREIEKSREL